MHSAAFSVGGRRPLDLNQGQDTAPWYRDGDAAIQEGGSSHEEDHCPRARAFRDSGSGLGRPSGRRKSTFARPCHADLSGRARRRVLQEGHAGQARCRRTGEPTRIPRRHQQQARQREVPGAAREPARPWRNARRPSALRKTFGFGGLDRRLVMRASEDPRSPNPKIQVGGRGQIGVIGPHAVVQVLS